MIDTLYNWFKRHKLTNSVQVAFTGYMVYQAVQWGMAGNLGKVLLCIGGVALGLVVFSYTRDLEERIESWGSKPSEKEQKEEQSK